MSTKDISNCQQLHQAIYDYVKAYPGQPSRQIKFHLEPKAAAIGLKNVSIQSFISVQKNAGLLEAFQGGSPAKGGPASYRIRTDFSYKAILDYERFKRDNRAIAVSQAYRETFPRVPKQALPHDLPLTQKLAIMMTNHTPEVFMKALGEAIKLAY